jgi:hypothetical protein
VLPPIKPMSMLFDMNMLMSGCSRNSKPLQGRIHNFNKQDP